MDGNSEQLQVINLKQLPIIEERLRDVKAKIEQRTSAVMALAVTEETRTDDPPLDMLQIFVRPTAPDLEPVIQHGPVPPAMTGAWRHLVGPEGSTAPFFVRNTVDIHDIRLVAGSDGR